MNTYFQRGQALWWLSNLKESISSDGILGTGRNEVVGAAEGWVVCVLGCFHSNSNLTVRALEGRAVIARAPPSYPVHLGLMVEEGYSLSSLFSGTLHAVGYIFPFLPCLSLLFYSQLFLKPPQKTTLLSRISYSLGWFW